MHKILASAVLALAALSVTAGSASALSLKLPPLKKPAPTVQHNDCADEIGYLRPIRADQVATMGEFGNVYLVEMCAGEDKFGELFSRGNASGLRKSIAHNDILSAALYEKDFQPMDVFGIKMGANDSVYLYVHKSGY